MSEPERPPTEEATREDEREFAGWLAPFLADPSLWPVLVVTVTIFGVMATAAVLMAIEGNGFAWVALALAFWISVDVCVRAVRRGASVRWALAMLGFWLATGAAAFTMLRTGWF